MANILIGITGSIAAYKSCDLISQLRKDGHDVKAIMTESATQFITPLAVETISRHPVSIRQFNGDVSVDGTTTEHIALARWADVVCVAPAAANFLCKYAWGIADNLLVTELLAYEGKVLVAPAMNHSMYNSFQVREAVARLQQHGVRIIDPAAGELACGEVGVGKMAAPETIAATINALLTPQQNHSYAGKKVVVTAGPTRAWLDPVRFISNPSSGKMGYALAHAARALGADVTLISGPVDSSLSFPKVIQVQTAAEMLEATRQQIAACDLFIAVAAVNDFAPAQRADKKIKKNSLPTLKLQLEPDVVASVAAAKSRPKFILGFAAETPTDANDALQQGRQKLRDKDLDAIFINDVTEPGIGFGADDNGGTYVTRRGRELTLPRLPKNELAHRLLEILHADLAQPKRSAAVATHP